MYNFPPDQQTTSGAPFWSGPKRCPVPMAFDPNETLHLDYVWATANLKAEVYGVKQVRDRKIVVDMVNAIEVGFKLTLKLIN